MKKRQIVFGAGALTLVLGLAIGIMSGFSLSRGEQTKAENEKSAMPIVGVFTNEKIEALKAELEKISEYESAYGCTISGKASQLEFCGESKKKVDNVHQLLIEEVQKLELANRSEKDIAMVKASIQLFTGSLASEISFQGTSANPYTNTKQRIEHWADAKGFDYWVNPVTNNIVQFGPGPDSKIAFERNGEKSLSELELQKIAEAYLAKNIANFAQVKAGFSYSAMSKPGNVTHAFRWEAKSRTQGEDMSPFVQVALSPIGEVMSFTDTRSLYSSN